MAISARDIVYSVGLAGRPEVYSGRGARKEDLPPNKLVEIYEIIKEKIGVEQAISFVTMVENLESLSATNFLNALYFLEANNWVNLSFDESDIDLGPNDPGRMAISVATIFSSLSSEKNDTEYIRHAFLSKIR